MRLRHVLAIALGCVALGSALAWRGAFVPLALLLGFCGGFVGCFVMIALDISANPHAWPEDVPQ